MPVGISGYRVFIASPGGLKPERETFRKTINESNDDAVQRGALFIPVGWEDTLGGMGRPQGIINEELHHCDYFVLLLWDRWGTPTSSGDQSKYSSGTEEEFRVATACFDDKDLPLRQVVAFFKAIPIDKLSDPGPQLTRVLDFKRELEANKNILFHVFDDQVGFESQLRRHLAKWLRDHDQGIHAKAQPDQVDVSANRLPGSTAPAAKDSDGSVEIRDRLDEAERFAQQGFATDAEAAFALCVTKYREPDAFNRYGVFLLKQNRLAQAEVMFREVESLAPACGPKWESIALMNLGVLSRMRQDLDSAESLYKRALEIDRRLGREKGIAAAEGNLGTIAQARGDLASAERLFRHALKTSEGAKWIKGMATQYCNLGMLHLKRRDLAAAERSLSRALDLETRLGRIEGIADASSGLGLVYQGQAKLDLAEEMQKRALRLNEQLGRLTAVATQWADLGVINLKRGDLAAADDLLRKALKMSEALGARHTTADVTNYLGLLMHERKDFEAALEMHLAALSLYQELGFRDSIADQYCHLGSVFESKGDQARAIENWQLAANLFAEIQQSDQMALVDSWAFKLTGQHLSMKNS